MGWSEEEEIIEELRSGQTDLRKTRILYYHEIKGESGFPKG